MRRFSIWLLLQLMVVAALGQHTLRGIVTGNGEPLPGASLVLEETFYGVSAGRDGRFEFRNLREGRYRLQASFMGYEAKTVEVEVPRQQVITVELTPAVFMTPEVLISATRAKEKTPVAYTNVSSEEIARRNMGQDIPYLLQLTPSFVVTSDAGAGIGYTKFRIRGTDMTRINVTVNGIPLNDAESHGTWFVDQPDLASSLENVQVQRGVGTSTNGAAAFGATINLQTNALREKPWAEYNTAAGSFNTLKNTVSAGTGLMKGHFTIDTRLSKISSDGFIDRSFSDLKSFYLSGGYYAENTIIRANIFSGIETTYQAWNGVPSVRLNNDIEGMQRYGEHWLYTPAQVEEMINSDARTYNLYTYGNQVDYYQQDHYQLHFSHQWRPGLNLNASGFYIRGLGYYENFKEDEDLADYQLPNIVVGNSEIESTNLVNRKWLDNHFYGATYSLNYRRNANDLTLGGGWNRYDGHHYGNVIWAAMAGSADPNHEWYRNKGEKKDFNLFGKYSLQAAERISLFADLQYRRIDYTIDGIDDDLRNLNREHRFNFFNPKLGLFFQATDNQSLYLMYAIANREPNRTAYTDTPPGANPPVYETLYNTELGYEYRSNRLTGKVNLYVMNYRDQLVLTGQINDVGNPIMVNVEKSYRAGIELQAGVAITRNLVWTANATISRNKIDDFTEYVDNWDTGTQDAIHHGTTDIAFSPNITAGSRLAFEPVKKLNLELLTAYAGKQYIDNSANAGRQLNAWLVNDLKAGYTRPVKKIGEVTLHLMVNNLLNEMYESNGWVYSYILEGERYKMDGYFPQAGRHFLAGLDIKF